MKPSTICSKKIPIFLQNLTAAAAWIMLWQLCYWAVDTPLLLASPGQVLERLWLLSQTAGFWRTVFSSLSRILLGFLLAAVAGCLLATLSAAIPGFRRFLRPPVAVARATPVASFIILALVWIPSAYLSVFVSFLMVLPIFYENVDKGIQSVDKQLLEMGRVYGFSRWKTLRFLYFPAVLPFFTAACVNGLGFAWKSGIAAEVLGTPKHAIGSNIYDAKIYLEIPDLFAWTAVVIALSMILEQLLLGLTKFLRRKILLEKEGDA